MPFGIFVSISVLRSVPDRCVQQQQQPPQPQPAPWRRCTASAFSQNAITLPTGWDVSPAEGWRIREKARPWFLSGSVKLPLPFPPPLPRVSGPLACVVSYFRRTRGRDFMCPAASCRGVLPRRCSDLHLVHPAFKHGRL